MENKHNMILDGAKKGCGVMFFAANDGQGGLEISRFFEKEMSNEIKETEENTAGAYEQALIGDGLYDEIDF